MTTDARDPALLARTKAPARVGAPPHHPGVVRIKGGRSRQSLARAVGQTWTSGVEGRFLGRRGLLVGTSAKAPLAISGTPDTQ
jgi:hypothetical protein